MSFRSRPHASFKLQIVSTVLLSCIANVSWSASFPSTFEPRLASSEAVRLIGGTPDIQRLGQSVGSLGDIDGDGYADVFIGAESLGLNSVSYLFYGSADKASFDLDSTSVENNGGIVLRDTYAARSAGDINGDGLQDWIHRSNENEFSLVFGSRDRYESPLDISALGADQVIHLSDSNADSQNYSKRFLPIGDFNNDGYADLVLTNLERDASGYDNTIKVRVLLGQDGGFPQSFDIQSVPDSLTSELRYKADSDTFYGPYNNSDFDLVEAGDLNGDGHKDIVITASYANQRSGMVFVVFGGTGSLPEVIEQSTLDGSNGFSALGPARGFDGYQSYAGHSTFANSDINGDQIDDLVIGAYSEIFVVYGKTDGWQATLQLAELDGDDGYRARAGSESSFDSIADLGDINGDGIADWAAADQSADAHGIENSGRVHVVYGNPEPMSELNLLELDGGNGFTLTEPLQNQRLGAALAGAGDVNGDGVDDMLLGSEFALSRVDYQPGATFYDYADDARYGMVYVVYGQADAGKPLSISGLRAALAEDFIELRWDAPPETAVESYQIMRDGDIIGTVSGSTTSFFDTEAQRETNYTYSIQVLADNGVLSAPVSMEINNDEGVYPNLGGEVYSESLAEIIWTSENIFYNIYRDGELLDTLRVGSYLDDRYSPAGHTYFVDTLPSGEERIVRRSQLLSLPENAGTTPPGRVQDLRFELYSDTSLELFWSESTQGSGPFSYQLIKDGERIAVTDGLRFLDDSIQEDATYHRYEIVTIDANGGRSSPAVMEINLPLARQAREPARAENLSAAVYSKTTAELFWRRSEIGSEVSGYEISRDGVVIGTSTGTSFFDDGLSANQRYSYTVTAYSNSGTRSQPSQVSAVTPGGPSTPENLRASVYGPTTAEIFWDRAQGAATVFRYEIYRDGVLIGETAGTSFMDYDGVNGETSEYKVVSVSYGEARSATSEAVAVSFTRYP